MRFPKKFKDSKGRNLEMTKNINDDGIIYLELRKKNGEVRGDFRLDKDSTKRLSLALKIYPLVKLDKDIKLTIALEDSYNDFLYATITKDKFIITIKMINKLDGSIEIKKSKFDIKILPDFIKQLEEDVHE